MSMHKGLIGKTEGGASVKTNDNTFDRHPSMKHSTADTRDKSLSDYINRKYKDDAFNVVNVKDYSADFPWVAEFIDNKEGVLPLTAHYMNNALHIQGHGSALVLLSSGKWFMTDTSGG